MFTRHRFVLGYQTLLGQSVGSIYKGPKTLVPQLLVYAYKFPEEQRPELHVSGGVKSHNCFCFCVQIGTIYIICSESKGGIQPVFVYSVK